ncbi:GTP 3',8-cyclase MoaA [Alteromonas pelagimontana]|uniref:GTP 3',8-cyclase n=1 Tax=Alteromonas pelagimontana TaxID=1858656 RepID=A0A6M4MI54_9ALTE|nr:GTP 3',8-cyclase MoaA [Alteromonas pelagimontana]QJR82707.1 GTP 3',8-cyclase MoaA [Alteromonas pelagimontana]
MLEDNFGRRFHYLRLSITEACNFRCQYCLPDGYAGPSDAHFLSLKEIETLVTGFAGLGTSKIRITGGEPSLRRDFSEIIQLCKSTPGIRRIATTTHGGRLAKYAGKWKDAGLDQVNVSIDSLDPHQFAAITGQDKLQDVLKGLDVAVEQGLDVKVNTVLLQDFSPNRLQRFLTWLKDTPVTLRFIELMQTGDHARFFEAQHLSGEPLKQQLIEAGWQPLLRRKDAGPAQEFYHPDYAGRIGLIMPYSKDFCKSCNRLRVAANGRLHLCLFSEQGIDVRSYLQKQDVKGLQAFLHEALAGKHATHYLKEGQTGATRHLAMLGG